MAVASRGNERTNSSRQGTYPDPGVDVSFSASCHDPVDSTGELNIVGDRFGVAPYRYDDRTVRDRRGQIQTTTELLPDQREERGLSPGGATVDGSVGVHRSLLLEYKDNPGIRQIQVQLA
nr:hypothetical protein [Rhodococcus jostii]